MKLALLSVVSVVVAGMLHVNQGVVHGATVAQWRFESMNDLTPSPEPDNPDVEDPPGGEQLIDDTSNHFDFIGATNGGTYALNQDISSVSPPGSLSFECDLCGATQFLTQSSSALHRQSTGMTVEFRLKYLRVPSTVGYLLNFDAREDGCSGASCAGDWGIYVNGSGDTVPVLYEYSTGYPEISTFDLGIGDPADGNWHHIAFTIDADGLAKSYIDGQKVAEKSFGAATAASAGKLMLGGLQGPSSFANHGFLIDDLRISSVALAAGTGSGVNELAWNAPLQGLTPAGTPGDFNSSGVVDAADYTLWRDSLGSVSQLANDPIGGTVGQDQYNLWKSSFGQGSGAGGIGQLTNNLAVPEPTVIVAIFVAIAAATLHRKK